MNFKDEILEERVCKECGRIIENPLDLKDPIEVHIYETGHKTFIIRPYFKRVYSE